MVKEIVGQGGIVKSPKEKSTMKQNGSGVKGPGSSTENLDILQNMSSSELAMIHRLAGNDPEVRKATIRKLRKWLKAIAKKVPDTPDSRGLVQANFGRVWKAMFYCMWMADKPLPQETLAEQISNFVSIFSEKPNVMMLFVEWFFITFVREWPWIDRLRMDKFMMLIRRFLRKMLQEFSRKNWEDEHLDPFLKILTTHLFNHHPQVSSSKRRKIKSADPFKAPLGFQIHIVDVFLEELAKVVEPTVDSERILKLLSPFVEELAVNDDNRLLDEIKQRVFHHLMKQSDVGIDYVESRGGAFELMQIEEDEDKGTDDEDEQEVQRPNGALDPRAGAVDVVLPQLKVDYAALVEILKETAGRESTRARNRKLLLALARQFETLLAGEFPLGTKREGSRIPAIKRSEIEDAAMRLIQMEEELKEPKLKRKKKKERQKEIPVSHDDSQGSEDGSQFLEDSQLMDHISDNYDGYLEQMENGVASRTSPLTKEKKSKTKKKPKHTDNSPSTPPENSSRKIKTAKRKAKSLGVAPSTPVVTPPASITKANSKPPASTPNSSPATRTSPKSTTSESAGLKNGRDDKANSEGETYVTIKRKRRLSEPIEENKRKVQKKGLSSEELLKVYSSVTNSPPSTPKPIVKKVLQLGRVGTPGKSPAPASTPSSGKKKVNFVLGKNLEHPHADYEASIQRSPAIPYDGNKRPSYGLLKPKSPATPKTTSPRLKRLSKSPSDSTPVRSSTTFAPRKRASDFF